VAASFPAQAPARTLVDIADVPLAAWRDLFNRAIEPNAFYHPAWARAASQHSREAAGAKALLAFDPNDRARLIGLMPVVSAKRALGLPLPLLVAWQPYTRLTTPLLDAQRAEEAAALLIEAARAAGARAILHNDYAPDGAAAKALHRVLAARNISPRVMRVRDRARLDATVDADAMLHDALGAKKLKELRRQRNRLEDTGEVKFTIASSPAAVSAALDKFFAIEASGWKGARGTALADDDGDVAFMRASTAALAAEGLCEIVTLFAADKSVASGIVLRHASHAYFFKIAYDEQLAKSSPGVQLTLDLTRRLCGDAAIAEVDSTANAYHPMIDKIWRGRLAIATALIPLNAGDPFAGAMVFAINARERFRRDARRYFHLLQDKLHGFREKFK
jgi:CelD/BcsL family acetyltransferase involved in cellulose biosynthesis